MTHLLDSSAALAFLLVEPSGPQVKALFENPAYRVGISNISLLEVAVAVYHRSKSWTAAEQAVANLRALVAEVAPVTEEVADLARTLRRESNARIATADLLIAATAAHRGADLVHRDAHFLSLPADRPGQTALA